MGELNGFLAPANIYPICLLAPTTTAQSMDSHRSRQPSGYFYYVSLQGYYRVRIGCSTSGLVEPLKAIRQNTGLPIAVGFGIKDAQTASQWPEWRMGW